MYDCCNSLMHDENEVKLFYSASATNGSPASQTSGLAEYSELLSYIGEMEEYNSGNSSRA